MTTIALVALGYVALVAFVLVLLTAAKRGDEAMVETMQHGGHSVEILRDHASLGRVAAQVSDVLAAERVTVVIADPDDRDSGVVAACLGAPGLLGSRVPVEAAPATGSLGSAEAAALGLTAGAEEDEPWAYAHVPLACAGGRLGAVTLAARRMPAFSPAELHLIETLARHGASEFERRRVARTPRTTV